jgi:hypothetical protein
MGTNITLRNEPKLRKEFFMKNVFRLIGFIAIAAVIGFTMTACDSDGGGGDDVLNGTTWEGINIEEGQTVTYTLKFNTPKINMVRTPSSGQSSTITGTYSVSGNTVTIYYLGETITGTLSGNTLALHEDGEDDSTYTKQ